MEKEFNIREYGNLRRQEYALQAKISKYPAGSVQKKQINGKEYYYIAKREGKRVVTDYVSAENAEALIVEISHRREFEAELASVKRLLRYYELLEGKRNVNLMHIKECVRDVIADNPSFGVDKVTLFGSRAGSGFRTNSDVDLLVHFAADAKPTLLTMSAIRLAMIDRLGLDVDLVPDPIPERSNIEIGKTIVIYAG